MASLGKILSRMVFWSYDRGTWQYDMAVVLILIFVLLTPQRWFHDQPQVGISANASHVQLLLVADDGHRQTYRVDTRVLAPPEQTPALQNELHNALQRALPDLKGRFSIGKINPVRDAEGTVIAYEVEIRR